MSGNDETRFIERRKPVSLSTPVQIGLILSVAGFVVGAIWWAATMQSKLDQLLEESKAARALEISRDATMRALELKVGDMEARLRALERKP